MLDESKKVVAFVAELVNVGSKIVHKKGVFTLFQLSDEAMALGSLNVEALKAEWVSGQEKANLSTLVEAAKQKLDLENKDAQAKIGKALDLGLKAFTVLSDAVSVVSEAKLLLA